MRKSVFALILCLVVLSLLISGCAKQSVTQTTTATKTATSTQTATSTVTATKVIKPVKLNMAVSKGNTHFVYKVAEEWGKMVEEKTNGAVQIQVYADGALVGADEIYDAVLSGIVDIGWTPLNYNLDRHPLACLMAQSFLGIENSYDKTQLYHKLVDQIPGLQKETSDVHVLWYGVSSGGNVHTIKPCRTLADFKGLEIRCSSGNADVVKTLGVVPVTIKMGETYLALEKGIVQGVSSANEALLAYKLAEVCGYTTQLMFYCAPNACVIRPDKWNSLSPDIQKAINEANVWAEKAGNEGWNEDDAKAEEYSKSKGHEFIYLGAAESKEIYAAVKQVPAKWAAELDAKNLPGTDVMNSTYKLVEEYLSKK